MNMLWRAAWKGAQTAGSVAKTAALGGGLSRMALGAAAGALYGAVTNDYNDPNAAISRIGRLALYGGAAGGLSRLFTPKLSNGKLSGIPIGIRAMGSAARHLAGPTASLAKTGATAALNTAGWAIKHPYAAAGIVGGAYAYAQYNKTPYGSGLSDSMVNQAFVDVDDSGGTVKMAREQEMLERMNSGISPMGSSMGGTVARNQRLMASTYGLVQGLSSGRHG